MYERFYQLAANPFELTPNPRYLLLTPTHREALSALEFGISTGKGVTLLIGEAGTGKTTLLRRALAIKLVNGTAKGADCIYINNPTLTAADLMERLALDFRISDTGSKTSFLRRLEEELAGRRAAGRKTALVVDEAQSLPDPLLEELRLLTNIESDEAKLLPLVLAGQPELAERLNDHRFRQFKQRIVLRCELKPLSLQETATYIFGRVKLAGGNGATLFTRDAVMAIWVASGGIPRTISVLCDNALVAGFALQRRPVGLEIIDEVCRDLDLALDASERAGSPRGAVHPIDAANRWPRSAR
jgi:general secretion pathway protein A